MSHELVKASAVSLPATGNATSLPVLVERAGEAARFAWDEYFYAEHHNPHTQKAYMRAVRPFLGWTRNWCQFIVPREDVRGGGVSRGTETRTQLGDGN
jgi:hypothetical protein